MASLLLLIVSLVVPLSEVKLDNKGRYLGGVDSSRVFLNADGSVMAASQYQLWHWDAQGNLLNVIGGKGEGPGEFVNLGEVLWTGDHYWIIDGSLIRSSIFSAQGVFLGNSPVFFRQFVRTQERLLVIDMARLRNYNLNYPPVLVEVDYNIDSQGQLSVRKSPHAWRKMTPAQTKLKGNFKLLWVVERDGRFLVMDQIEPRVQIYDQATIEAEQRLSDDDQFEVKGMTLALKDFVPAPERWPARQSFHKMRLWWNSWSRITWFGAFHNDLAVAYTVPNEADPDNQKQIVARIGGDGQMIGEPVVFEDGYVMGVHDNKVYVFYEGEEKQEFVYKIRTYAL